MSLTVRPILIFWILLGVPNLILGQSDMSRADKYLKEAIELKHQNEYQKSIRHFMMASNLYRKSGNWQQLIRCYNGIANNQIVLSEFKEAWSYLKRSADYSVERNGGENLLTADAWDGMATYHRYRQVDMDKASGLYLKALAMRKDSLPANHSDIAKSYRLLGDCFQQRGEYATAMDYYNEGLLLHNRANLNNPEEEALICSAVGDFYYTAKNDFKNGLYYHQRALRVLKSSYGENSPAVASTLLSVSRYYALQGNFKKELELLERALQIQTRLFGSSHIDLAKTYKQIGERYLENNDPEKALSYLQNALSLNLKFQGEENEEVAALHESIGRAYLIQHKSIDAYVELHKSLGIRLRLFGRLHPSIAKTYQLLGDHHGQRQNFKIQRVFYNKSLTIYENIYGENHLSVSELLRSNAHVNLIYGDAELAEQQLLRAHEITIELLSNRGSATAKSYLSLAQHYDDAPRKALGFVQKGLIALLPEFNDSSYTANPSLLESFDELLLLDILTQKARLLGEASIPGGLLLSMKTADLAMGLVDSIRTRPMTISGKEQFLSHSYALYETAILTAKRLYDKTKTPKYLEKSFLITEKSKATMLFEAWNEADALLKAGLPQEVLESRDAILYEIKSLNHQIAMTYGTGNDAKLAELKDSLFVYKMRADSIESYMLSTSPEYERRKYGRNLIGLKQLKEEHLNEDEALLEYFIGEEHIFIFSISQDTTQLLELKKPYYLKDEITELRKTLSDYDGLITDPDYSFINFKFQAEKFARKYLFSALEPVKNKKNLIIIPDGMLWYLPFEVLPSEKILDEDFKYSDIPYLIKEFGTYYAYSASSLQRSKDEAEKRTSKRCLGFAPSYAISELPSSPNEQQRQNLSPLPGAINELELISTIWEGDYIFDSLATESTFKEMSGKEYGIIHLAMHGFVNNERPMMSRLAFTNVAVEDENDNILYTHELHDLNLNAQLVVLSACETGFGKTLNGEGAMSFARGFMHAGIPSAVMTLWKVNDFSSSQLVPSFYKYLKSGYTSPEALRRSKLQYLKSTSRVTAHPAYWAGFVSLGAPVQLSSEKGTFFRWSYLAIVVLLIGLIVRVKYLA